MNGPSHFQPKGVNQLQEEEKKKKKEKEKEIVSQAKTTTTTAMSPARYNPSYQIPTFPPPEATDDESWLWAQIKAETHRQAESEPLLATFLYATVLSHPSFVRSISFHLANRLGSTTLLPNLLYDLFLDTFGRNTPARAAAVADLIAARKRDPACDSYSHCLLHFKGFLALQAHRVAHVLWQENRRPLAFALQSRISDVFAVDIHPGATFGRSVLLDHATGIVIGETSVIGNDVSILHHVTLGANGKDVGDRHPKIGDGALIGAGATIIGRVKIGEGAKVGAGSVVLRDVPPWTTVVGNPGKLVVKGDQPVVHKDVPGKSMDQTSFIYDDYVI